MVVRGGSRQYDMSAVQTHNHQVFVSLSRGGEKIRHIPLFQLNSWLMQRKTFLSPFTVSHFIKAADIMSRARQRKYADSG